jgi:hypothetical protein
LFADSLNVMRPSASLVRPERTNHEALLSLSPDVVLGFDEHHELAYANEAATRAF